MGPELLTQALPPSLPAHYGPITGEEEHQRTGAREEECRRMKRMGEDDDIGHYQSERKLDTNITQQDIKSST